MITRLASSFPCLHFHDDGQDHRAAARFVEEIAAERVTDIRLDCRPLRDLFLLALFERLLDACLSLVHERF